MPASEIDDIFAGKVQALSAKAKGKAKAVARTTSQNAAEAAKKKSKKRKIVPIDVQEDDEWTGFGSNNEEAEEASEKRKKKKKRKRTGAEGDDDNPTPAPAPSSAATDKSKPQRLPETVVDPSLGVGAAPAHNPPRRTKESRGDARTRPKAKGGANAKERKDDDLAQFADSRGTGPRRRTDEGFLIYKEDELGIRDEGGDTPLCPFDCDCCF